MLLLAVFLGGCATPNQPGDETRWHPQLLYLNRSPHPSLYVELGAVDGTGPSEAVVEQLREFLTLYCDKPEGIRIVRDKVIPRADAQGLSHEALTCRYLQGPPADATNPAPAFMYILYYDSTLAADPRVIERGPIHKHMALQHDFGWVSAYNPHAHLMPYPGVVYIDRRYLRNCPSSLEGLILKHEAGHLLGLVQNESHGLGFHCTNRLCLMRAKLMIDMPRALFSAQKTRQTNLCASCRHDLSTWRAAPALTNVFFVGPVLIRAEQGYFVATLPGELKLFSGELTKFDVPGFVKEVADDADEPWAQKDDWTHYWASMQESPESWARQLEGIEKAKEDSQELVRAAATNTIPKLQRVLGLTYLKGEGMTKNEAQAVKWFRKAAEAGDVEAARHLGHALAQGQGCPVDLVEACKWLRAAAEQGDKPAKEELEAVGKRVGADQLKPAHQHAIAPAQAEQ